MNRKRLSWIGGAATGLVMALTACSSGPGADDTSPDPAESVGRNTQALAGTTTPLPITTWNSSPSSGAQDLSTDSGFWADQQISASTTHVIVTQRASIGYFNRIGTQLVHTNGTTFFDRVLPANAQNVFDLRTAWDRWRNRFVIVGVVKTNPAGGDRVLVAVSKTQDPVNGGWCVYGFGAGVAGVPSQNVDYPMVGVGATALFVTYTVNGVNTMRIFPAQQMADCVNSANLTGGWAFTNLTTGDGGTAGLIAPAMMHTNPADNRLLGVTRYGTTGVTIWKITNPTTDNRLLTALHVELPGEEFLTAFGQGNDQGAPQPVGTFKVGMYLFDGRTRTPALKAVYRQGQLGFVTPDGHDWGGGITASIRFVTLNPDTGAISRNRKFGASGLHYGWPGVEVNTSGDWAVSFMRSGTTSFPEARYAAWGSGDTDFRGSVSLKAQNLTWSSPNVCGSYCAGNSVRNGAETSSSSLDPNGGGIWFSTMLPATSRQQNFTQWVNRVFQ